MVQIMEETKAKKKRLLTLIFLIITLSVSIALLVFSGFKILKWHNDNKDILDLTQKIEEVAKIEEVKDNEGTEIIEQENISNVDPYWDYIKVPLINVDFDELKKINDTTVGWIQVKGTNINYPFVQANNNSFYLSHSFDKSRNAAGWVFLDYRNKLDKNNKNTILYAHGRLDTTMFGSLKNILTNGWLRNKDNYIVKLSTPYENTLWQVFSVYQIPTTSDYIRVEFNSDEEFLEFANMLKDRSSFDFDTTVSAYDKILTLSTCFNSTDKVVLHAKLIKKETRNVDNSQ